MNITVDKIIEKMMKELQIAKQEGNSAKVREHFLAIRTLCDLVLDEAPAEKPVLQKMMTTQIPTTTNFPTPVKLDDDEANGDSLFDF